MTTVRVFRMIYIQDEIGRLGEVGYVTFNTKLHGYSCRHVTFSVYIVAAGLLQFALVCHSSVLTNPPTDVRAR